MVPAVLRESDPLPPPPTVETVDALAEAEAVPGVNLDIEVPEQEKGTWCWAAACAGIIKHFDHIEQDQCFVATRVLGGDCCQSPCDQAVFMDIALSKIGHLVDTDDQLPFSTIQSEIGNNPVCCWIDYGTPVGHFVIIIGWTIGNDGREYVFVVDPAPGAPQSDPDPMLFADFQ